MCGVEYLRQAIAGFFRRITLILRRLGTATCDASGVSSLEPGKVSCERLVNRTSGSEVIWLLVLIAERAGDLCGRLDLESCQSRRLRVEVF